jgi:multisubunit Na+/H+ antiporter MnhF subunit
MIETTLTTIIYLSLAVHILLVSYAIWRVWRGENEVDRLLATELVGTLTLAVLVLLSLLERNSLFLDVALGLGTLGFIGIVAYAKFVADQRMF